VAGGWKSGLPHEAVAQIEQAWGHIMRALGYETVTSAPRDAKPSLLDVMGLPQ